MVELGRIVVLAAFLATNTGCGNTETPAETTAETPVDQPEQLDSNPSGETSPDSSVSKLLEQLEGETWRLQGSDPGTEVTASFSEGVIQGKAGCNRYRAMIEAQESGFEVSLGMRTKMACAPELMVIEEEYLAQLGGTHAMQLDQEHLTLTWNLEDHTGTLEFQRVSAEPGDGDDPVLQAPQRVE